MGERLTVQFARGPRHRDGGPGGGFGGGERNPPPRPRRTPHRMQITGLPSDTSWQVCVSPVPSPWTYGSISPHLGSSSLLIRVVANLRALLRA